MAPVRRYLRITKRSVLEVRVYADRPQDVDSWLLRRGDPALPRIIQAIKPLVLPKLREENERSKSKKKADKKGLKDSIAQDDFEVSIFLTDNSSRHSLLTKQKTFSDAPKLRSNSSKMTGWLAGDATVSIPDEDDEEQDLSKIPDAADAPSRATNKRKQPSREPIEIDESSDEEGTSRKRIRGEENGEDEDAGDEKKKMGLNTSYDGFSIYGRILCLIVKRKGPRPSATSSRQMLEGWVSTQAAQDAGIELEADEG